MGQKQKPNVGKDGEGMRSSEVEDYCDGCKHLRYSQSGDIVYCKLDKEPKPHPDEPEHLYCESKEDELNEDC